MALPESALSIRKLATLCRGGLPLLEAIELTAAEAQSFELREAHRRLSSGAPLAECFPDIPPTLKPFVRLGERSGMLIEALDHLWQWWTLAADIRLPLLYLGRALETIDLRRAIKEGREVFECHQEWREISRDIEQGKPLGEAARSRTRALPRPLDVVIARAESSQTLASSLQVIARGALLELLAYEPPGVQSLAMRQALFSVALMLTAGAPLREAITVAGAPLATAFSEGEGLAAAMSRQPELFPLSVAALVRRAEYAGDLAKTLEFIATEVIR